MLPGGNIIPTEFPPAANGPSRGRVDVFDRRRNVFVGRKPEMASLVAALEDAVSGCGGLVLVGGEPGIGKTALAGEFSAHGRAMGALVAGGRCWEGGGAPAFWPWTQSMRGLFRALGSEDIARYVARGGSHLARMMPELREALPDLAEPAPGSPEVLRFRLFEALTAVLQRIAEGAPTVVILEDLHAADASSLLLLRFVAEEVHGMRLLVLATYRDVELTGAHPLSAALPELTRAHGTTRMTLSGLSQLGVVRFIHAMAGQVPSERFAAQIYRGTGGHPLFVRELVGLLSAEGRLEAGLDAGRWPVPQGVRDVIGNRLDRLPHACRQLLTVGSVMGRDLRVETLERITGRSPEEVLAVLHAAVSARIVAPVEHDPGRLRFTHVLIREVLYDDLLPADRMRAHRQVGEALEALYAGDPESHAAELAHHFCAAGPVGIAGKAVQYATVAGIRAVNLLAYEEGVRLFRMALTTLERSADEKHRCEVSLLLGDAEARCGDSRASRQTFVRAAESADRLGLAVPLAEAALGYGGRFPWLRAGVDRRLVPLLRQALDALGPADSVLRVRLLSRLAGALRDQPSTEPRVSLAREAVAMARRVGDAETLIYALMAQWAAAFMCPDGMDQHAAFAQELDGLTDVVGDRELAATIHAFRFVTCMAMGQVWEARVQHEAASRLAAELRQPAQRWLVGVLATVLALQDGRFDEAEQLIAETAEVGSQAQAWDARAARLFQLFVLRREQGRLAELEEELRQAPGDFPGYRSLRCMLLAVLCDVGRLDEARALFDQFADGDFAGFPRDNEWLFALTLLAEAADALEDRDRSGVLYEQLRPYGGLVAFFTAEASAGPVSRPLGLLAARLGRCEDAARHFEDAIEQAQRMQASPWAEHARYAYAAMLADRHNPEDLERAGDLLAVALPACEQMGMVMLARRVTALMARIGAHGARAAAAAPGRYGTAAALTPREREVAGLLAKALSNRQIAERLYVSERTVESHVQHILAKLGMTSRTEVVVWALQRGLDEDSAE